MRQLEGKYRSASVSFSAHRVAYASAAALSYGQLKAFKVGIGLSIARVAERTRKVMPKGRELRPYLAYGIKENKVP